MITFPVHAFKSQFSDILNKVRHGEKVGIVFGRNKRPIAMLVPFEEEQGSERKIGILDGKAKIVFSKNYKITPHELLGIDE
jgi:antitoxin (DNA-binding transcriptional repressor) of toxin-antitoxin stability system